MNVLIMLLLLLLPTTLQTYDTFPFILSYKRDNEYMLPNNNLLTGRNYQILQNTPTTLTFHFVNLSTYFSIPICLYTILPILCLCLFHRLSLQFDFQTVLTFAGDCQQSQDTRLLAVYIISIIMARKDALKVTAITAQVKEHSRIQTRFRATNTLSIQVI